METVVILLAGLVIGAVAGYLAGLPESNRLSHGPISAPGFPGAFFILAPKVQIHTDF